MTGVTLVNSLDAYRQRPSTPPANFVRSAVDTDDNEMLEIADASRTSVDGWALCIEYRDSKGAVSCRDIECRGLKKVKNGLALVAYCHVRDAVRSFRIDRILTVTDYDTGEIHDPPDKFIDCLINLGGYGDQSNGLAAISNLLDHEIRILVFVARSSGKFVKAEIRAIADFVYERMPDLPIETNHTLETWLRSLYPSTESVVDALYQLNETGRLSQNFINVMQRVVLADGEYQASEHAALRVIVDGFKLQLGKT